MNNPTYLVFANDEKMKICMRILNSYGLPAVEADCENLTEQLKKCTDIILPLPTVKDGFIAETTLTLQDLARLVTPEQRVYCGNIKNPEFPCKCLSYYFDDEFLTKNSELTAQGVLRIILENLKCDMNLVTVAVLGYGRCGKAISRLLARCGFKITSFSRRSESIEETKKDGFNAEKLEKIKDNLHRYDVVVNTIPFNIIDGECLSSLDERNTYIEIASKPYGFDNSKINEYKFKYILAESLPGRFTPFSAGRNIAETVIKKE
ncbi:MAG: NAD(P)-dependent oxidoreductase [Clostridia bacterium]|nr:NAD(P)-dependent oxidoreductase [Clostridia bacterium]